MGYPVQFALRYLGSKKRASISVGTMFAVLGVALGVAALATIMSVTGGFHSEFRQKVLGVNAHVLVLKYSTNFREYRSVMEKVVKVDGVRGVAPFSINPMMLTHGDATATGVLVKGVDPRLSLGVEPDYDDEFKGKYESLEPVLDLPKYIVAGSLKHLRLPDAKPAKSKYEPPPEMFAPPVPTLPVPSMGSAVPSGVAAPAPSGAPIPDPGTFAGGSRMDPEKGEGGGAAAADEDEGKDPWLISDDDSIEPEGGYASELPEDDVLPPDVDADPCDDPEAVKHLPGVVVGVSLAKTLGLAHHDNPDGTRAGISAIA